jgi:hypothetical protein
MPFIFYSFVIENEISVQRRLDNDEVPKVAPTNNLSEFSGCPFSRMWGERAGSCIGSPGSGGCARASSTNTNLRTGNTNTGAADSHTDFRAASSYRRRIGD